jgi:hypothetical protein
MKTKLLVGLLMAGGSLFAETHVSIGIGGGGYGNGYYPPSRPPAVAYAPVYPGPGYRLVNGYWDNAGPRRYSRDGYWAAPGYARPYGIDRRYRGGSYENRYDDRRRDYREYDRRRDYRDRDDRRERHGDRYDRR